MAKVNPEILHKVMRSLNIATAIAILQNTKQNNGNNTRRGGAIGRTLIPLLCNGYNTRQPRRKTETKRSFRVHLLQWREGTGHTQNIGTSRSWRQKPWSNVCKERHAYNRTEVYSPVLNKRSPIYRDLPSLHFTRYRF